MATFELNSKSHNEAHTDAEACAEMCAGDTRRLREESIIALKIYDSCRQQDCLNEADIGPARAAEDTEIDCEHIREGEIIVPPHNAAAVNIDRLRVKRVIIVDKDQNPFKSGYWDIDLKYIFEYKLTFYS